MNSEINIGNKFSIGIDSHIIGAGIGCILNRDTRIFGLTLFCFFILIKIPRVQGKIQVFKIIDYNIAKLDGKTYVAKPHITFIPKLIYYRTKPNGLYEVTNKFKIIEDLAFKGVIIRDKVNHTTEFYNDDEYKYFRVGNFVKGYLKDEIVIVLSIVD